MATLFSRNIGPLINPLTKFPLAASSPGQATLSSPQHTNVTAHPLVKTTVGNVAVGRPVAIVPIATKANFKS